MLSKKEEKDDQSLFIVHLLVVSEIEFCQRERFVLALVVLPLEGVDVEGVLVEVVVAQVQVS